MLPRPSSPTTLHLNSIHGARLEALHDERLHAEPTVRAVGGGHNDDATPGPAWL